MSLERMNQRKWMFEKNPKTPHRLGSQKTEDKMRSSENLPNWKKRKRFKKVRDYMN